MTMNARRANGRLKRAIALTALAAASMGLSGCQSIFGTSHAEAEATNVDMGDYFEGRLAVGRYYLEKGLVTKAVIAFRQASYDPEYAGEAYNGMAIAYDRLGRTDLAHRYFTMAVAAAPRDDRFTRNLARLEGSMPIMPDQPATQQVEMAELEMPVPAARQREHRGAITIGALPGPAAVSVGKVPNSSVKVASREAADAAAPVRTASRPAIVKVGSAQAPAVRVEKRETLSASRSVVQRARRSAQARRGYPIRFSFNDQ
ncbi:tetratricopeptide repeat protein [Croceicoccus mobilis]|uniref:Tetratricopeptide repeat protein n=1 Tax=Croceicoccus mobilis TaxID=1703339 RepID=A0A916YRN5_9SPHN|nr:hypothetical protein [Croceicoccus mobilis]GGD57323.1 hypothetical protein GCM10010990_03190 [Croceicoccus mobilis]